MLCFSNAFIILVLALGLWGWANALRRLAAGRPILEFEPREPVPWGLVDVLFTAVTLLLTQVLVQVALWQLFDLRPVQPSDKMPPLARAVLVLGMGLAQIATAVLSLVFLRWSARARLRDVGIDVRRFEADVRTGLVAFAMLAPPVYAIQAVLTQWFPSEHPLISLLQKRADPFVFAVVIFAAVLVAPVVEEYFFRVLLQGWLEKVLSRPRSLRELLFASDETRLSTGIAKDSSQVGSPHPGTNTERPRYLPILASAALFAWMHAEHGPDPIPLFVLAVGLGYLYQRTHRILPSILVHFLLNYVSLAVLVLEIGRK
jgi:membrane protease YdiL (CAAX protease family)